MILAPLLSGEAVGFHPDASRASSSSTPMPPFSELWLMNVGRFSPDYPSQLLLQLAAPSNTALLLPGLASEAALLAPLAGRIYHDAPQQNAVPLASHNRRFLLSRASA